MKRLAWFFLFFLIVTLFYNWFFLLPLGGLDQLFLFKDRITDFGLLPAAWRTDLGNGLGGNGVNVLWIETYLETGTFFLGDKLGLSWELSQRILFLWPYLVLSIVSPLVFFKKLFPKFKNAFVVMGILVYSFNTYILMVISGGQIAVAIAYSLVPIFLSLVISQSKFNIKKAIVMGLCLGFLILFDLRIAFVALIVCGLYLIANLRQLPNFILSIIIALLLHSFWLLPSLLGSTLSLPEGLGSEDWLSFLSVANFSNTLSLLHPNWPENIFGKVYFMRAEFILIPVIAFAVLVSLKNTINKSLVVFFVILGLLGAFLAKGVNPPFGEIYRFLYNYLPFFTMFRDPTKFYLLISLSYSVLIPYSLFLISERLNRKLRNGLIIAFFGFWLVLLLPLLTGRTGSFKSELVSREYQNWANFLTRDKSFSRTLWLPKQVRYSYFTDLHPNIRADLFFRKTELFQILSELNRLETLTKLQDLSVKYVAVPLDIDSEIFLTDRKYNANLRSDFINSLNQITYLSKIPDFQDNLNVYLVSGVKDHFYVDNQETKIFSQKIDATKYLLTLSNVLPGTNLVFTESFDSGWKMRTDSGKNYESSNLKGVNSFLLSENGNLSGQIYYEPQRYVFLGSIISVMALLVGSFLLIFLRR